MAKWYIMESPDQSERAITQDKSSYDDWVELGTSTRPPAEDEEWDRATGKWKVDVDRKAQRERATKFRDPEHLLSRIEALEARLLVLERGP